MNEISIFNIVKYQVTLAVLKLRKFYFKKKLPSYVLSLSSTLLDKQLALYKSKLKSSPASFMEIGANFFQDAAYCQKFWNLSPNNIIVIEANTSIFNYGKKLYPHFIALNIAIGDEEGKLELHLSPIAGENNGVSSLLKRETQQDWIVNSSIVNVTTIDKLYINKEIPIVDFIKLDVEGFSFQALSGAKKYLNLVKMVQAECEITKSHWKDQQWFFTDVNNLMRELGFQLVYFELLSDNIQCDCSWINTKYL